MKNLFLSMLAVASLFYYESHAQVQAGLKLGANFNQFSQPGTLLGVKAGAFGTYSFNEFLGAEINLLYNQQGGGRENFTRTFENSDLVTRIDYLNRSVQFHNFEVPLLLRIGFPDLSEAAVSPKLLLGGAYGFAIGAFEHHDKLYTMADGSRYMLSNKLENVGSNYEQHQFGFIAGLAVDHVLENGKLMSFEIRYRHALNEVNLINFAIPELGGEIYPTTISFNFNIGLFEF